VPVISQYDLPTWLTALVKAGNFLIYCAVLLFFWKKNERPTAMVYELVTLALVTILISPVSWRHHYLLTLIPIIYLWVSWANAGGTPSCSPLPPLRWASQCFPIT
jgi:hypothetical protein